MMYGLRRNDGIVKLKSYGTKGQILRANGEKITNVVFIMMEYIEGGLLFSFCRKIGPVSEEAGREFLNQLLDIVEYMHGKNVVHRDIKTENILVDKDLNLKLTDFGLSSN